MGFAFTPGFRAELARACGAFPRLGEAVSDLKPAAVAIVVTDAGDGSGDAAFLLTRRASHMRAHAGQWALPGGRCDPGETLEQAALRELHEELGVSLGLDSVLGMLDDYPTRSGYVIAPVVVWLDGAAPLTPNPDEVASVHRIGLDWIVRDEAVQFETIVESDRAVIRLNIGDQDIHAPTAALVYQFRELLAGRVTRVADLEQPRFAWA